MLETRYITNEALRRLVLYRKESWLKSIQLCADLLLPNLHEIEFL